MNKDISQEGIHEIMERSWTAFMQYRNVGIQQRAALMRSIASKLENSGDTLIVTAMRETNLPEARLKNERGRTVFQLNSYAEACEQGHWLDARVDSAMPDRNPPRPDIRKMNMGLGPVVVFGSSNFPFAYSTAGGDTATALAAGCSVVVKAHPAHPDTSDHVASIIAEAVKESGLPEDIFLHVHGVSFEVGRGLVMHEKTKAVGFTGSFLGGKQLYDWAQQRTEPIPVFSEMGSVNPVFLFPLKLKEDAVLLADQLAGSITLGVGQFCTNPGLIIGIDSEELNLFESTLSAKINGVTPGKMLHAGISKAYAEKRKLALSQADVELTGVAETEPGELEGQPTIASASGDAFLNNPVLHKEVFGPYSLVVRCSDVKQLRQVAEELEGQLTCSMMATEADMIENHELVEIISLKCGRMIMNGVPTGVEVCWSMQHGGPFPSTTDSRFGSVGPDAIKRFVRPVCFQNFPDSLLPEELKSSNSLRIPRIENGKLL
ncbi:MAG TPA: aldehyde dehydrogenase (NADP(+)) [Chitinophagaceae bacterium]|nr:aldehyde dehydrogenase (NADP(+)) [Chitinophagaceae bacterium]